MTTPTRVQVKILQKIDWRSECIKDFDEQEKLGEGSYGSVFHSIHRPTQTHVALKSVKIDNESNDISDIEKEIILMKACDTDFIVRFYGHFMYEKSLYIVMEICGAGSVSDIMHIINCTLSETEIQIILKDTLKGLAYLHQRKMIHRDIKAANILVSDDGVCKLADFGVSTKMGATNKLQKTLIGSPYWMAPEVILESGHNEKADIWSVGITAIEMYDGRPPHSDLHPMRAIFSIPNRPPPNVQDEAASKQFKEFIALCCVKNFTERKSAVEILEESEFMKPNLNRKRIVDLIKEENEKIAECGSRKKALEQDEDDDEDEEDDDEEEDDEEEDDDDDDDDGTMVRKPAGDDDDEDEEEDDDDDDDGTMVIRK